MGVIQISDFNLAATVESGQIFRWEAVPGGYRIAHGNAFFEVVQKGDKLRFGGISRKQLSAFFRLDEDHVAMVRRIDDPTLRQAVELHYGLRLIRQDPWECSIGFLCSQMSNVKRIMQNMQFFSSRFGERRVNVVGEHYTFPDPALLGDSRKLKGARLGYRAKYIAAASRMLTDDFFAELRRLPYLEAKQRLMGVPGVGEKVADCILLYSLEKMEAFPVDVWVKRVMEERYFGGKQTTEKSIRAFAAEKWGNDAGYAQQYLFHWRRMVGKERMGTNAPTPLSSTASAGSGREREGGRSQPKEAGILV